MNPRTCVPEEIVLKPCKHTKPDTETSLYILGWIVFGVGILSALVGIWALIMLAILIF